MKIKIPVSIEEASQRLKALDGEPRTSEREWERAAIVAAFCMEETA